MKSRPVFRWLLAVLAAAVIPASHATLAAWYPLNEAQEDPATALEAVSGATASLVGYDPDPLLTRMFRGGPSCRTRAGKAYQFTRTTTTGAGLDLGGAAAVQPTDKFTISFWFRLDGTNTFARFLESQAGNANTQHGIRIDSGSTGNRVRVLVRAGASGNTTLTHARVLQTNGTWYFAAFRYNTTDPARPFALTVLEGPGTATTEAEVTAATEVQTVLATGVLNFPHARSTLAGMELANAANANNLNGMMDDLAFHSNADGNGVLTDAQLAAIKNFGPLGENLIASFSSTASTLAPGASTQLNWSVAPGFTRVTLSDGVNPPQDVTAFTSAAGTGSRTVTPGSTTTYTLAVSRGTGPQFASAIVIVGAAPLISSFTGAPDLVAPGTPVTFAWNVTGADTLLFDPGAVKVTGLTQTVANVGGTTTYTLQASNTFGTSSATFEVITTTAPLPQHRYFASDGLNTNTLWDDRAGTANWTLVNGLVRQAPLATPSPLTAFTASYQGGTGNAGGYAASFVYPGITVEAWIRPAALTADYECLFETGGGQNGCAILINNAGLRFLGSSANVRNVDLTLPLDNLNLSQFAQVVFGFDGTTNECYVSISDTWGNVRTASATGDIVIGANTAALFGYTGSAVLGGTLVNLGGFTEVPGAEPSSVTGFAGEIAALRIYSRLLTPVEIDQAFDELARTTAAPVGLKTLSYRFNPGNTLTYQWNSTPGRRYLGQFSTDMSAWFELEDPFEATVADLSKTFALPPALPKIFVRIKDVTP
jgi:hypothetical protein